MSNRLVAQKISVQLFSALRRMLKLHDIKEVSRLRSLGLSQRMIAKQCHMSRNTVQKVFKMLDLKRLDYLQLKEFDEGQVQELIDEKKSKRELQYELPDYEKLSLELTQSGVTMQLLWEKYVQNCRKTHHIYTQMTQFKKYFNEYLNTHQFTDVIQHKPGERIEVY